MQFTEGQRLRGRNGEMATVINGVPVPDAPQGGGVITPAPVDPRQPFQVRREAAEARTAEAEAPVAGPRANAEARRAVAQAQQAEAELRRAQRQDQNATDPRNTRIARQLQTDSVLEVINTARRQIGEGWATGNVAGTGFFQGVPFVGQNSANLAGTISGLQGNVIVDTLERLRAQSATGASGFGSLTEREAERLAASVAALQQTQDSDALLANLARVERHYRNALALLNNEDPRDPAVATRYGIMDAPPESFQPRGSVDGVGEWRVVPDPTLAGTNATVARMIRSGRTEGEIRRYLNSVRPGFGDRASGLREAIEFSRQHPDRPIGLNFELRDEPATQIEQTMGAMASWQAPGGFSPGAAVIGAGDIASFGTLDNMTSNPDLTRALLTGVQMQNPHSYFAGQIGGGVTSGLGFEAGLARAGLTGLGRARAGDFLLGAGYGAGSSDDGGRFGGALLGGGSGLVGGMAGRGTARGLGRTFAGIDDVARVYLDELGVRMTPGQLLGGTMGRTEDRLAGLPFIGDQIRNRRIEGIQDFNVAAFDQGLAPVNASTGGVTAEHGVDLALAARSQAYRDALDPVTVQLDADFLSDMQPVVAAGQSLPSPMSDNLQFTLPTRVGQAFDDTGALTGRDFQQAIRGLRRDASAVANEPYGFDFGQVTQGAEGALEGILQRQSPATVPAFRSANEANRNVEVLRAAVNAARNGARSGDPGLFMPSQLADAAAQNSRRFGNTHGTTQQPFFDLTRAGQEVLPSTVPDSGTTGRALIPAALLAGLSGGGTHYMSGEGESAPVGANTATGGLIGLLLAAPYSQAARAALQRLLVAERPAAIRRTGDLLLDHSSIAGLLAAPAAATAMVGQ